MIEGSAIGKELRILMLEDAATDAELMEHELRRAKISFTSKRVETREDFVRELYEFAPDLILSDYRLPSFDGLKALDTTQKEFPDMPFILVTGALGEEKAIEVLKSGASDYVLKDNLSRLPHAVLRAIREAEGRRERKQARKDLEESLMVIGRAKREWESTVDSIPQLICLIDSEGYILRTNRMIEQWNLGQVVNSKGKKIHELLHPGCADSSCYLKTFWSHAWEELRHGRSTEGEFNDPVIGRYLYIQVREILPKISRKGEETASYAVVVVHDITERKRTGELLRESEEKHRKLFEGAIDAIFVADAETGTLIDCNRAAIEMVGREKSELIGKHQRILHPPEDIGEEFSETFKRHLKEKEGQVLETRVITKNGEIKDVEIKASSLELDGKILLQGIFRDITERKQADRRLKEYADELEMANKELRRLDEIKSEFVAVASHELRTPLATIKNAIQLLLQRKTGDINENQEKFLSLAEKNINRLTNILNSLLDLSKIESGRMELNFEEVNLRDSLEFIVSSFKPQVDGKSIQIEMEVEKDLPSVYADREKIIQVMMNLVGNAIKFTPQGGMISISAKPYNEDGNMVAVSVRDSGIGIPEDQLEKVFEKFHQVEESLRRSTGGTGLGLAITKGLVEAHQGKIWAESEIGEGSTFTFTLPVSKGEKRDLRFRYILDKEFQRAMENHSHLTLFFIEMSTEGAEVKDTLLDQLEEKLKQCLGRKTDVVLRLGRGKILSALCEADLEGARVIRQRIDEVLQKHPIEGQDISLITKVGMATYPEEALSKRELFRKAKEYLRG
ncbi:MAG TPA: ATP-binding protein [Thermodesulfovibrionales bacterium]|nr:ATP-binding protein [Thermodesulfovibrionales bacterium]